MRRRKSLQTEHGEAFDNGNYSLSRRVICVISTSSDIGRAFAALKEDYLKRSIKASMYCNEVGAEVLDTLNNSFEVQSKVFKDIKQELKNNKREYEREKEILEAKRLEYERSVTALDISTAEYESTVKIKELTEDRKAKYMLKINQLLKDCKDAEISYRSFAYSLKEIRNNYIKATKLLLGRCQTMEEERVELIKNAMLTIIKKEQELNPFTELDLKDTWKMVSDIEKSNEVRQVIKLLDPQIKMLEDVILNKIVSRVEKVLEKFNDYYAKGDFAIPFNFEAVNQAILSGNDSKLDSKAKAINDALTSILDQCWNGKKPNAAELSAFRDIIKLKEARQLFCSCLNCYRKEGLFCMSSNAFVCVAALLKELLVRVNEEKDVDCALSLIVLSQTFYCNGKLIDGQTKIYLQQGIANDNLFKKREFWEQVLEQPLASEKETKPEEETAEEQKFMEENEVFVKLGTYSHNMLQFGLPKEQVEAISLAYAKKKSLSKEYIDIIQVFHKLKE
eukprot:TRINITY_DN1747_c0_g3_i1.p1 TRINITY_DN1747_c0_g3~~TRINITY_DN1747_c0_g3_i1.p1  ORF type:complete len:506 (+),score=140.43 TRINITY_DN1747_c0_g3_i1:200-1717(+)